MAAYRAPRPTTQMLAELERALRARLSRPCRFRRRQPDRQQEGAEGLPAAARGLARSSTTIRSSSRPRPRINLADDDDLLQLMQDANFFAVFVGIESPDPRPWCRRKKQNTRAIWPRASTRSTRYGMFVTAGFIVGFDSEKVSIADAMADFIEESRDSRLHGRAALCAAQYPARRAAWRRKAACMRATTCAERPATAINARPA